jgi:hypothetical protein
MRPFFVDPRDIRNIGLYFLFCAVLPLAWIVAALFFWRNDYTDFILYVAGGIALIGAVLVYWHFDRIPRGPNEAELKKRMAEMMAEGEVLATETTEPLSPAETGYLARLNIILVGVLIIVFSGFAWISYYPAREMLGDPWTMVIPSAIALGFGFLIYKYSLMLPRIVKAGKKEVVQGIITSRRTMRHESSNDHYYLTIGTRELHVSKRDYRTYNVGEVVRIDFIKDFGGMVLKITRMSER